ncbi:MAG: F0F1 ATP synthase subunit beta, partial [Aeriscardovia sp.]|nr:F0F1 ATP synthase subunit beta [Aeriscardovia sp.]
MEEEEKKTDGEDLAWGRVVRVQGTVVDVEFAPDHVPSIYTALKVKIKSPRQGEPEKNVVLEVEAHLGDSVVRTVALGLVDGLVRGTKVFNTGSPISVPVGKETLGHVFNVTGDVLNLKDGETIEVKERWPIHRKPPAFDQLESQTKMFETGIKVIDL